MTPERYRRICDTLDRRQPDLTVIMDGVHKPHNIAAIVRTCDAVGILDVHAVLPKNRARMAAGTAMGSQRWVKVHKRDESTDVIRELQGQGRCWRRTCPMMRSPTGRWITPDPPHCCWGPKNSALATRSPAWWTRM